MAKAIHAHAVFGEQDFGQGFSISIQNCKQDRLVLPLGIATCMLWRFAFKRECWMQSTCPHQHLTINFPLIVIFCRQSSMCQPQRATEDVGINQHAFIRVHVHPKRFPAVYTVDWKVSTHATTPGLLHEYNHSTFMQYKTELSA